MAHIGQPLALRLEDALPRATTDDLVQALFKAVTPFVEMFRATLEFFKTAGATEGRQNWSIRIDEEHLGLEDFEQFISAVSEVPGTLDVPDLQDAHLGGLWKVLTAAQAADDVDLFSDASNPEIASWLKAYRRGEFPDLPEILSSFSFSPGFEDVRRILAVRVNILRKIYVDRETMMQSKARRGWQMPQHDPFHPASVSQAETDFWTRSILKLLLHALRLPPTARDVVDRALQAEFAGPRRIVDYNADATQLERILSLPVWQRRHELYAVWIATEIVAALPDHEVELHHENGRIVFAFKETVVARVLTSRPERRLISERRSQLKDPIGAGRTSGVQPDYGIWSGDAPNEQCQLVVEVKHYKRAKNRSFGDVLQDYARAHMTAKVVLVNHGPVGDVFTGRFDNGLKARCETIGHLTSRDSDARGHLAELVRATVGDPVRRRLRSSTGQALLLVDVSGSMRPALKPVLLQLVRELARMAGVATVTLVDVEVVDTFDLDDLAALDTSILPSRATDLGPSASDLLDVHPLLLALTDAEGTEQLHGYGFAVEIVEQWGEVRLAEVRLKS
ncbi:hypothetical protein [Phyllobacterium sophorae]|uniref:hypothetical protein n=1 Tax=Phyllobacterium sophorae TaxID=1520277 RepID=UPI0011B21D6A|nr:hypothetical protein [Phyllobacterium sophorae]